MASSFTVSVPSHFARIAALRARNARPSRSGSGGGTTTPSKRYSGDELQDLRVNFDLYGKTIPIQYGNGSNLCETLYARDLERIVTRSFSSSGKGGGSSSSTSTVSYAGTRIMQISKARPNAKLLRIEMNGRLVYDATSADNPTRLEGLVFRFHPGGPDETVDPILIEDQPANRVLAYKHLCTIAFDKLPLAFNQNIWPAVIEVTLVENDSQTPSSTTITPLSATGESDLVFNWASDTYYRIDHNGPNILSYSINDNTQTSEIPIDETALVGVVGGSVAAQNGDLAYMPSVDRIFGSTIAGSTPNGHASFLLDPVSGYVVYGAFLSATPGVFITRYEDIIVSVLPGVVETYLFAFYNTGNLAVFSVTDERFDRIHQFDPGTGQTAMSQGPRSAGSSKCYVCWEDEVYEYTVEAGATAVNAEIYVTSSIVYTATANINDCWYDQTDGGLILWLLTGDVLKISVADFSTILWTSTHAGGTHSSMDQYRIVNRIGFATGSDTLYVMDTTNGEYSVFSVTMGVGSVGVWDDFTGSFFKAPSSNVIRAQIGGINGLQSLLRDLLSTMMLENGYAASEFDFSAVPDLVDNVTIKEDSEVDAVLFSVARMFGLDLLELEKIYLVPVPSDGAIVSSATIDERWLVGEPQFTDADDFETPRIVDLAWLDPDQRYKFNNITLSLHQFPTSTALTDGEGTARLRAPVGMNVGQVTTLGYKFLNRERVERKSIDATLGPVNLATRSGDQVTIDIKGVSYLVHVGRQDLDPATFQMETEVREMLQQATGNVDGAAGVSRPDTILTAKAGRVTALNAPLFRGLLDQGGNAILGYAAVAGVSEAFAGATVIMSLDSGASWEPVGVVDASVTEGRLIVPPAAPLTPFSTDYINTMTVRITAGDPADLSSATYEQVLAGANALLVGADGRWEVMKVETWVDNGDGTFTGSGLHRSHLGSEFDTGTHAVNDKFFVLDERYILPVPLPLSALGQTVLFRAVGHGARFEDALQHSLTITGRAEKPNAPVQTDAVKNGSDIDLSWVRQTRGDGAWLDGTDTVPLLDVPEQYEIDILDGPGGNVVGTHGASAPLISTNSFKYLNADIISELGSLPGVGDDFTYVVYQINSVVGRGFGRETTITF